MYFLLVSPMGIGGLSAEWHDLGILWRFGQKK